MRKNNLIKKCVVCVILAVFCRITFNSAIGKSSMSDYPLPPPTAVDMILEESIMR